MSRSDGSARPPLPAGADARAVRDILRPSMGEVDWSVAEIRVGDRVHILATCYCPDCRGIRSEQDFIARPQHRWFGKCSLPDCETCGREFAAFEHMADEDEAEARHRASWRRVGPPEELSA